MLLSIARIIYYTFGRTASYASLEGRQTDLKLLERSRHVHKWKPSHCIDYLVRIQSPKPYYHPSTKTPRPFVSCILPRNHGEHCPRYRPHQWRANVPVTASLYRSSQSLPKIRRAKAQAQATCAISKLLLHGCQVPRYVLSCHPLGSPGVYNGRFIQVVSRSQPSSRTLRQ